MKRVHERRGCSPGSFPPAPVRTGLRPPSGRVSARHSERRRRMMTEQKAKDEIVYDHNRDGITRRGFLKCMAWAGTGAFCVIQGGVLKSYSLSRISEVAAEEMKGELSFVQISDSHMGFNKPANPDVAGTLRAAVDKINALARRPGLPPHTGASTDITKQQ